jgi:hypothetical protein
VVYADPAADPQLAAARLWGARLEGILAADEARSGLSLTRTVSVVFAPAYPARCPARGLAAPTHDPPLTVVYLDQSTSHLQLHAVLAHELGHQLTSDPEFVGDGILTEGVATWIASQPMLAWLGLSSWDQAVAKALVDGDYESLTDPNALSPLPGEDCLIRRDRVYEIRTSFVGWLVDHYGLPLVLAMPYREATSEDQNGQPVTVRQPDYLAATGHDLHTLEWMWLQDVMRRQGLDRVLVWARPHQGEVGDG